MVWEIVIACHLLIPITGLLYIAARRERERTQLIAREALMRVANTGRIAKW